MKIQDLIDHLQRNYKPDESIVVAWWDQDHFDAAEQLSPEDWAKAADYMENMRWSYTHDALCDVLDEFNNQAKD